MALPAFRQKRFEDHEKERMTLTHEDAYMLPQEVRIIRVLSGTAWVSLGHEDVIVRPQEILYLHHNRLGVVVTALGKQQLEFEMIVQ